MTRAARVGAVGIALLLALGAMFVGTGGVAAEEAAGSATAIRAGMPLVEAFEVLEGEGLAIVYSSSLVRPEMAVVAAPRASRPADVLAEILAPHGLGTRPGPHGTLIVVRRRGAARKEGVDGGSPATVPTRVVSEEIFVTPSAYSVLRQEPEGRELLTRDQVARIPHLADDLYRVVGLLPGTAAGDISAKFHVRGGEEEETLVVIDGLEVYEPFHLKDFQSAFSIVDSQALGALELYTGGFPAEYGNRMSGVLDISTAQPAGSRQGALGASVLNLRAAGEGSFAEERGGWLVSARRGYLDFALDLAASDEFKFSPKYFDFLAKAERWLTPRTRLAGHLLASDDHTTFFEQNAGGSGPQARFERADSSYGNGYAWLTLDVTHRPELASRTLASVGRVTRDREIESDDWDGRTSCTTCDESYGAVRDRRSFDVFGLKQEWTWSVSDSTRWKWGGEVRRLVATYDYRSLAVVLAPLVTGSRSPVVTAHDLSTEPTGVATGAFASARRELSNRVVVELGLRWDRQSYAPGPDQLSPRAGLLYLPTERSTVRFGWGRFFQPQGIHELQIEDGVDTFFPAQLAEHRLAAVEHRFASGVHLRLEAYQKHYSRLRPRWENLFEPIDLAPEAAPDRVRIAPEGARVEGIELVVHANRPGRLDGWLSYGLSSAVDEIGGEDFPRSWDQRHALTVDLEYRWAARWSANLAWIYHTGWPTTPTAARRLEAPDGSVSVVPELGRRNSERFPPYHRLDLRVERGLPTGGGELRVFLDVTNVYNRDNVRAISDFDYRLLPDGRVAVEAHREPWLPRLFSGGVGWRF